MSVNHKEKRKPLFHFNPLEISFCGYHNSGKTTVIAKVISALSAKYRIGYVKHTGSGFQLDQEGKDSSRMTESGAAKVYLLGGGKNALLHSGENDDFNLKTYLIDCDFIISEGFKGSDIPKIIVTDNDASILQEKKMSDIQAVIYSGKESPVDNYQSFHRDDIALIAKFVEDFFIAETAKRTLNGLVLIGGKSRRMGQDKADLIYHGVSQTRFSADLLSKYCNHVFISCREDQKLNQDIADFAPMYDKMLGFGPAGGIMTALMAEKNTSWFVLACDLPFIEEQTLDLLLEQRNPFKTATVFSSSQDGLPEPLCAIYEPKSLIKLMQFSALGYACPRKVLLNSEIQTVEQKNKNWLENVNNPEEFQSVTKILTGDYS